MQHWIKAARPRTLILGLCGPAFVYLYAFKTDSFSFYSWLMFTVTLLLLQVVSNFANDLGDGLKGSDSNKSGEQRMFSSGKLNVKQFKTAIISFCILAFLTGCSSLYFSELNWQNRGIVFALGLLAIAAALTYTLGKKAYGYSGLGDLSVMLFFGFCAVAIPLFLCTNTWSNLYLAPTFAIGFLSVAVLNLNNLRDYEEDKRNNKKTVVVKLGPKAARIYHLLLLCLPLPIMQFYFAKMNILSSPFMLLVGLGLAAMGLRVYMIKDSDKLDELMKFHALGALAFSVFTGLQINVLA